MIKGIIFDLGGVLVDFSDRQYLKYLARVNGKDPEKTEKMIEYWWKRLDLGIIRIGFFEKKISQIFKIEMKQVQWVEFYERNVKLNKRMISMAKRLRRKYAVAFLSNIDFSRYDIALEILDLKWFDYDFASCYIKHRKPDPEAYRYVLKRMGLKSDEVIFIDNRLDNVIGARSVGIKSVVFKNQMDLEAKLKKIGVAGV